MGSAAWPADKVERRPIGSVTAYAKNARIHSIDQVEQIMVSMKEWGFTVPLLVDETGEVIAGHGRLEAARRLGYETVPVMVAAGWTAKQIKAYRIADNQLALNSAWDVKLLSAELGELVGLESLLGFSDEELERLAAGVGNPGLTDPDEVPPVPEVPATQPGDVWLCGKHRLLCGDATAAGDVGRLLGGVKPNLMVTDPPYGVNYDPKWRDDWGKDWQGTMQRRSTHPEIRNKVLTPRSIGEVPNDDRADWREAYALFPGQIAYVWHGGLHGGVAHASLVAAGFLVRAQIIWVKQHFVFGRGDYHWQHEPCLYAVRGKGRWRGDRKQTTVWQIANASAFKGEKDDQKTAHSTQKPVECMRRPIVNNSSAGQAVYDPFVGSGTTMIAAEMEARSALCLDIDPGYVDVVVMRWQAFTGEAATLEGDGRSFASVAEERNAEQENAAR